MKKRNIYMVQVSYSNGNTVYLPYAVGALSAYIMSDNFIKDNYGIADIFFLRKNPEEILYEINEPFFVGFSSYVWNFEYNKNLAEKIKKRFPECYIMFGGHHISPDGSLLEKCPYIDFLIHNEGEEPFRLLLCELAKSNPQFESIPNISFRKNGKIIDTAPRYFEIDNFPSPYIDGIFDKLMLKYPQFDYVPLLESSRGCPYQCTYCGWGLINSKIRLFPLERIRQELNWVSEHKCEFLGFADANFGMLPRDSEITDMIIEQHIKTGYPKKFQTSFAKNSTGQIFEITGKLNKYGLDKGVTLSFQSLSECVLKNIKRSNIRLDFYKDLLKKYNEAKIPTYSELIIGLPGENFQSFSEAVNTLLKAGQHTSIYIHMLEWLPCSQLADKNYMEKFDIKYSVIPLNQSHRSVSEIKNDIQEYSRIVTSTSSMTNEEWIKMNEFSVVVQCFHHLGILEFVAIFCYYCLKTEYSDFYIKLCDYLEQHPSTVGGKVLCIVKDKLRGAVERNTSVVISDEKYGDILWPLEEYAFLEIAGNKELFYAEIADFVCSFGGDKSLTEELLLYQKALIKDLGAAPPEMTLNYDFPEFFKNAISGAPSALKKRKTVISFSGGNEYKTWAEYAEYVVWFGRKGGKNFYEIT